jgi:hypothetical protein
VVEPALARRARGSPVRLEPGTVPRGALWVEGVNAAAAYIGLEDVRESVRRDRAFGSSGWTLETAKVLGLEYRLRPRGRPRSDRNGRVSAAQVSRRAENWRLFSSPVRVTDRPPWPVWTVCT